ARPTRRDDEVVSRGYIEEEQRSRPGCSGGRLASYSWDGTLGGHMFHSLLTSWLEHLRDWGYGGVFVLMAIESTVFPLPSELVVPPAAYWARQGHLDFWGIVLSATLGSWAGAAISYAVARSVGRPLILRYGRFVFVPEQKWLLAEGWINHFSTGGIFFARLLPVVRHLVSLPAGAARMPF